MSLTCSWWWVFLLVVTASSLAYSLEGKRNGSVKNTVDENENTRYEMIKEQLRNIFSNEIIPDEFRNRKDSEEPVKQIDTVNKRSFLNEPLPDNNINSSTEPIGTEILNETAFGRHYEIMKNPHSGIMKNPHPSDIYLNEWVVHLLGGEHVAASIVNDLGYDFLGPVKEFEDVYKVSHRFQHHTTKREAEAVTKHINSHVQVLWAEQQIAKKRDKRASINELRETNTIKDKEFSQVKKLQRKKTSSSAKSTISFSAKSTISFSAKSTISSSAKSTISSSAKSTMDFQNVKALEANQNEKMFNDELWSHQWYLFDSRSKSGLPQLDLKVIPVWKSGITGNGIKVLVVDDGLDWHHEDLLGNYAPEISYDLNDDDDDPTPRYDNIGTNSHGTKCAGEIAMRPNNRKCGVGIAYGASIGGIRMLDGEISDRLEGTALAIGHKKVDVVSCSWGPTDDGLRVEGPGRLARMALQKGVEEGRNGKGIIYVWAAGNGGSASDNCNCDGYASSIYTVSISSAAEDGGHPWYSENCASTLASAYSSGAYLDQKIVTTDLFNKCTIDFSGTSAAAPLVSGIVALALEAKPSMTWRDMQHAIVTTSNWSALSPASGWKVNGIGLHFNSRFGFGLVDAKALVNAVKNWTKVAEKLVCRIDRNVSEESPLKSGEALSIKIEAVCEEAEFKIKSLEHVEVIATIKHSRRGALKINFTSPSGTTTDILTPRPNDASKDGFRSWSFMSVHTWGEDPIGTWEINILDTSESLESGKVESVLLVLHGTNTVPFHFQYIKKENPSVESTTSPTTMVQTTSETATVNTTEFV